MGRGKGRNRCRHLSWCWGEKTIGVRWCVVLGGLDGVAVGYPRIGVVEDHLRSSYNIHGKVRFRVHAIEAAIDDTRPVSGLGGIEHALQGDVLIGVNVGEIELPIQTDVVGWKDRVVIGKYWPIRDVDG